jgi:dTDP-glucose 4,6-dehydratase
VIPLFITRLIDGKKVPLYGSGQNIRDWIHVDDNCDGIHAVLLNGKPGNIYNLGGGKEITNIELTMKILEIMGFDEKAIETVPDRKGHDFRYSMDYSFAKGQIGYTPKIDFQIGLEKTVNWYETNQAWWRNLLRN